MQLEGIDHIAMGVRDIERSAKWYIDVLGFQRLHDGVWNGVPTFIGKGNTGIALFPVSSDAKPTSSSHREVRILHLAFRATRQNFLAAQPELEKRGIIFEFQDHEISHSIYFRAPDGHAFEITPYELLKPSCLVISTGSACQAVVPRDAGWRHPSIFLKRLEIELARFPTLSPLPSQHFRPCGLSHSFHSSIHSKRRVGATAPYDLRSPSAAALVFFSTAARARFVAPNLWYRTANGKINRYLACTIAISSCDSRHRANGLTHACVGTCSGRGWRMLAHQELRQCRQEILECLQVRSAAEQIVQHFVLNVRHQFDKHVVGLRLVLDERVFLRVAPEINAFAQCVHCVEMFLPEPVNRVENDVALQAFDRSRFFVARLALVRVLDLPY